MTETTQTLLPVAEIAALGACREGLRWLRDLPEGTTWQQAWEQFARGDWQLWLLSKQCGPPESDSRKLLVLAACGCARLALIYVEDGETRPLAAIATAEAWARGEAGVTLEDVRSAGSAAAYAADAAAAASAAASAAYAAASVAYAAYAADAETLRKCADIVRKHYPQAPEVEATV